MVLKVPYFFFKSLDIMKSDKKVILLGLIPVLIGFACYWLFGSWVFGDLQQMLEGWVSQKIDTSGWIGGLITGILGVLMVVIMNITFFVFVSIVASPFNDLISSRVQKVCADQESDDDSTFSEMIKRLPET